jgi:hypothetical protein
MGGRLCGPRQWRDGFGFPLRGDGDGRKLRGYVGWLLPCGPLVSRLDELCVAYFGKEKTILDRVKTYPMLRVKTHDPLSERVVAKLFGAASKGDVLEPIICLSTGR